MGKGAGLRGGALFFAQFYMADTGGGDSWIRNALNSAFRENIVQE